jgi:ankyrin repeat protein
VSNPDFVDLPAAPNLEQQRKRAKDLLKAVRAGDAAAIARVRRSHPRLAGSASQAVVTDARVTDAQWVIAREYGFASWARLKAHIEALAGKTERRRPFETDLQYYRDRAAGMLSVFATGEQNAIRLVRVFHPSYAAAAEADIREAKLTQADAELILAREHGFDSFDAFARHIEALREQRVSEPFALAFAAIKADDRTRLTELLARHRGLANAAGTNGNRLIMLAMSFGRRVMVEDLLAAGADPNLPNNKGWTALHQAAYAHPPSDPTPAVATLERLLAAGASPHAEAYGDGGTPLAISLFWGHVPLAERLACEAVVPLNLRVAAGLGRVDLMRAMFTGETLLPEAGWHREFHRPHSGFPPWRPRDDRGEILAEALTYAARSGRIDAMAFLLERGAEVDAEPYNGTALHWAVARRRTEAAAWLLDHGADINRRAGFGGTRGVTPLHVAAAWEGSPDCARLLLARGADRSVRDALQDSPPAGWAAFFKNERIREMIKQEPSPGAPGH